MDEKALKKYQTKAANIVDGILAGHDFSEKEIMILAAAMKIRDYEPDCIICKELDSAELYLKTHKETGDAEYLEFARDGLKHAKKHLAALNARLHYATPKEIDRYNRAMERVNDLEPALAQI